MVQKNHTGPYYRVQALFMYRHYDLKYTIDLYCGLKFRHAVGCLICAVGLKLPVMYGGMYGASYILYGAAHTCMVRAVLVRAYSA